MPNELVGVNSSQMTVKPTEWRSVGLVGMRFWIVRVRVRVHVVAVTVRMRMLMDSASTQMARTKVAQHSRQVHDAQQDQHQPDGEFHRQSDARGNHPTEEDDAAAYNQNREGVAQTPRGADRRGAGRCLLARDDCRHRDDVIGIGCVAHSEEKSQHHEGESCHEDID